MLWASVSCLIRCSLGNWYCCCWLTLIRIERARLYRARSTVSLLSQTDPPPSEIAANRPSFCKNEYEFPAVLCITSCASLWVRGTLGCVTSENNGGIQVLTAAKTAAPETNSSGVILTTAQLMRWMTLFIWHIWKNGYSANSPSKKN